MLETIYKLLDNFSFATHRTQFIFPSGIVFYLLQHTSTQCAVINCHSKKKKKKIVIVIISVNLDPKL